MSDRRKDFERRKAAKLKKKETALSEVTVEKPAQKAGSGSARRRKGKQSAEKTEKTPSGTNGKSSGLPTMSAMGKAGEDVESMGKWARVKKDMGVLLQLFSYMWKPGYKFRIILSVVLLIGAKVATVVTPLLYKEAVNDLAAAVPVFPLMMIIGYGLLRFFSGVLNDLRDMVFIHVSQEALRASATATFEHLMDLSLSYHLYRKTGGVLRAIERGTRGMTFALSFGLFNIVPTLLEVLLTAAILFYTFPNTPAIALVTLVTVFIYVWFTLYVTEWRTKFRRRMNERDSKANNRAVEALLNYTTVKLFGNETLELNRYNGALREYVEAAVASQRSLAFLNTGQMLTVSAGTVAVMLLAAKGIIDGEMTIGDFVLVNSYLLQLYLPLNFLGSSYRMIKSSIVDMEKMYSLLDEPVDVSDDADAGELVTNGSAISFRNVSFKYPTNDEPIHTDVSFEVPAGKTVALVGASGAGKSTFINLLLRFYDLDSGAILIDGQDISAVTQSSVRGAIGVVPQDTVLFNDSVMENIRYARPTATNAEIHAAAQAARIHDFVTGLPEGYDTVVGERGLRLSGGEKQRVAIARAILKNPSILLLDEATSALDTETERAIVRDLSKLSKNRTTMVIAHRLSTIVDSDCILVFGAGQGILEQGTHDELLARDGAYAELWNMQIKESAELEQAVSPRVVVLDNLAGAAEAAATPEASEAESSSSSDDSSSSSEDSSSEESSSESD